MRTGLFEASLEEAKHYPQLWRLLLGVVLVVFLYVSVMVAMSIGAIVALAKSIAAPEPAQPLHLISALGALQRELQQGIVSPGIVLFTLATFAGLFVGTMIAAACFHFRGPGSLFGERADWVQGFFTALAVQIPILGILYLLSAYIDPPVANLALKQWLLYLPLALPLVFIQIGAEEVLFRGYLQQQLAARFAARWIWMGLPAVLFSLLHWTPQADANMPVILLNALIFGLIAADLTEQTGSLGAAMGLHFGNNVFGMLVIAVSGTITGLALWTTAEPISATGAQTIGFLASIAVTVLIWRITRLALTR